MISSSMLPCCFHTGSARRRRLLAALARFTIVLTVVVTSGQAHGQGRAFGDTLLTYYEDFEKPHWPGGTVWMGDVSHFRLDSGGFAGVPGQMLRLDAPAAGHTILYRRQEGVVGVWSFRIRQQFTPSASNRAWFFPLCDAPPDDPALSGYAVRLGESGSDKRIRLYRFDAGESKLLTSAPLELTEGAYDVQLTRDTLYAWRLKVRPSGQEQWAVSPEKVDSTYSMSRFSGFYLQYTATRRDLTQIDEVYSETRPGPFFAANLHVVNQNVLQVGFSHSLAPAGQLDPERRVRISQDGSNSVPATEWRVDHDILRLRFASALTDGSYFLHLDGVRSLYGGSPPDEHGLAVDVENPFRIRDAAVSGERRIQLDFDSPYLSAANLLSGFTLTPPQRQEESGPGAELNPVRPVRVDSMGPAQAALDFATDIPHGAGRLHMQGVVDAAGWILSESSRIVHRFHKAETGDVLVSEILFDTDMSPEQWVELQSATERYLNLSDWQLIRRGRGLDRPRPLSSRELPLPPGGRLVLSRDTSQMGGWTAGGRLHAMADFPGLNRSTEDRLLLITPDGAVSDSVPFDPGGWQTEGRSLERRSPDLPGWFAENWGISSHPYGFTPGEVNRPEADTDPPELLTARFTSDRSLFSRFSERLGDPDRPGSLQPPRIRIESDHPVERWHADGDSLLLEFSTRVASDELITVRFLDVADLFGNTAAERSVSIRHHRFPEAPGGSRIVLNEFRVSPAGGTREEFLELMNPSSFALDLSGWTLNVQGQNHPFDPGTILRPGNWLVLSRSPAPAGLAGSAAEIRGDSARRGEWVQWNGFPALPDRGFRMEIVSPLGQIVDSVEYVSQLWGEPDLVRNHQRVDSLSPGDDPSNWRLAVDSPTFQNPVAAIDTVSPALLDIARDAADPGRIAFVFHEFIKVREGLSIKATTRDGRSAVLGSGQLHVSGNRIEFQDPFHPAASDPGTPLSNQTRFISDGVSDWRGNRTLQTGGTASRAPVPGEVVLNEVLFDPIADPHDGLPDQPEIMELWNISADRIRLESPGYHFGPDENGRIEPYNLVCDGCHPLTPWAVMDPGAFAVVHPEPDRLQLESTRLWRYFGMIHDLNGIAAAPGAGPDGTDRLRTGRWADAGLPTALRRPAKTLSLTAAGGSITLVDAHGRLDSVTYSETYHHGFLSDFKGRSLERIRADIPAIDAQNWGTSADPAGGTPWGRNSISASPAADSSGRTIRIEPNPFTPDGDGSDDIAQIHYSLPSSGYSLQADVYDLRGRKVRTLSEGQPAGTQGTVLWDGRDRLGRPLPAGLYILRFEALPTQGARRIRIKHPVILAGVPP